MKILFLSLSRNPKKKSDAVIGYVRQKTLDLTVFTNYPFGFYEMSAHRLP